MAMLVPSSSDGIYVVKNQISCSPWHILVVERNSAIRDMLCKALQLAGYRVTAYTGEAAWIENIKQSNDPPALILLDLSILPMSAITFLQYLRTQCKTVPHIITLTTNKQVYNELVAVEPVFYKPFRLCELLLAIQQLLSPS